MREDTTRARITSLSFNDESSMAPSSRMPFSSHNDSIPSPIYQEMRSTEDENTLGVPRGISRPDSTSTRASHMGFTGSVPPQSFSRTAGSRTSSQYQKARYSDEENNSGIRKVSASSQAYSAVDGNENTKRLGFARSPTSQFTESDQFLQAPKESFHSEASSRRASYNSVRFAEFARGFTQVRPSGNRVTSDESIDLESFPTTPSAPWVENGRSGRSSPVASSFYLPNSGRASPATSSIFLPHDEAAAPVRPSMASMASGYVRILLSC